MLGEWKLDTMLLDLKLFTTMVCQRAIENYRRGTARP